MHEQSKIDEAEYFLALLRQVQDQQIVRFQLSAFLSAARSALQYALAEAASKDGGQAWYARQVGVDPAVKFLKEKRDVNIHDRPAPMNTNITVGVGTLELITVGDVIRVATVDQRTGEQHTTESVVPRPRFPPLPATDEPSVTTYTYVFNDWTGPEDVIELCARYLEEIRRIVADGHSRGFVTP